MAKKNKSNNRQNFHQPKSAQQPTMHKPELQQPALVNYSNVKDSVSESDFISKRNKSVEQIEAEILKVEQEKVNAENAAESARKRLAELEGKNEELRTKNNKIQADLNRVNKDVEDAQKKLEAVEKEAKLILDNAEREKFEILAKAADEARDAWKRQADSISSQIKEIADREELLHRAKVQFQNDKRDFDMQREDFIGMQGWIELQKEKYSKASPLKIEELTNELIEANEKYECLVQKYTEQTRKYGEMQVVLDSIKAEIQNSNDGIKSITINGMITALKELTEKYDSLARLHIRYQNDESLRPLEKKAEEYDSLQIELEAIKRDRDRLKEKVEATKLSQKELEMIRCEVDATNALNDHLLKELQSHKTALESRTGDTCPALTKVDVETENPDFVADINTRKKRNPLTTLSDIVSHIKHYAGSRKKDEQLFYTDDDIRAFLAGMAVSRLIILQGMSGTGKSSLPRIFSEAISGFNHLIPVESSWRDRNELLGYYNDFNKKFNAKSFTIELYRSGKERCVDIPTFIVLDEMNIARIEYYFSDFLAILQEPDSKNWLIELVSSDMRTLPMELPEEVKNKISRDSYSIYQIWERIEKSRKGELSSEITDDDKTRLFDYLERLGGLTGAKDLVDGRKVRVTDNIWFVGTANKDESTFEISDKVYDRAQVISLNKKDDEEKNVGTYGNRNKMYVSTASLIRMFEEAKKNSVKADVKARLEKIDKLLMKKFDVSFGYRIENQTIDFAAVFVEAGGKLDDALDYQISTKILRKVIMSDKVEALQELQDLTEKYTKTNELISKRIEDVK
jgi:hypothetical protein